MGKYSPRCGLILFCRVCLSAAAFANALRMPAVLVLVLVFVLVLCFAVLQQAAWRQVAGAAWVFSEVATTHHCV